MVQAILAGTKTQTRRVAKVECCGVYVAAVTASDVLNIGDCPYGAPGDRLWVRESAWIYGRWVPDGVTARGRQRWRFRAIDQRVRYEQPLSHELTYWGSEYDGYVFRPSIHLPRWASRITLEITDVRVERLQDISDEDVADEGVRWQSRLDGTEADYIADHAQKPNGYFTPKVCYWRLWDTLNAARGYGWDANPWVWVVNFTRTTGGYHA